jgi:hypothetical protein
MSYEGKNSSINDPNFKCGTGGGSTNLEHLVRFLLSRVANHPAAANRRPLADDTDPLADSDSEIPKPLAGLLAAPEALGRVLEQRVNRVEVVDAREFLQLRV